MKEHQSFIVKGRFVCAILWISFPIHFVAKISIMLNGTANYVYPTSTCLLSQHIKIFTQWHYFITRAICFQTSIGFICKSQKCLVQKLNCNPGPRSLNRGARYHIGSTSLIFLQLHLDIAKVNPITMREMCFVYIPRLRHKDRFIN